MFKLHLSTTLCTTSKGCIVAVACGPANKRLSTFTQTFSAYSILHPINISPPSNQHQIIRNFGLAQLIIPNLDIMDPNSSTSPTTAADSGQCKLRLTQSKQRKLEETADAPRSSQSVDKSTEIVSHQDSEYDKHETRKIEQNRRAAEHAEYRLKCLRELREHEKSQKLLDALAVDRLPPELLTVMEEVVRSECSHRERVSFQQLSWLREWTIGDSDSSRQLEPLFIQTMLKGSIVDVDFRDASPLIPTFMAGLTHHFRHLEISCLARVSAQTIFYPAELFRASRAIKALPRELACLQTLKLDVAFRPMYSFDFERPTTTDMSNITCRAGFKDYATLVEVVEELLRAFMEYMLLKPKTLRIINKDSYGREGRIKAVDLLQVETMEDLLTAAFGEED